MLLPLFLGFKRANLRLVSMFGLHLFIPRLHLKASPHPVSRRCFLPRKRYSTFPSVTSLLSTLTAFILPLVVLRSWLALSHGYHHLPEDDLPGCPEPVQLRGGGELGGHQSAPGQVQRFGQPQRCECGTAQAGGMGICKTSYGVKPKLSLAYLTIQGVACYDFSEVHVDMSFSLFFCFAFLLFVFLLEYKTVTLKREN